MPPLTHIQPIQELPNILIPHPTSLLHVRGTLADRLERVARHLELVLDVLGGLDVDARLHDDAAHELLADEVADLHLELARLLVLLDVDVDREVRVHVPHLVLVALGDAGDHVVDDGADGAQAGDRFARAVVHFDGDGVALLVLERDGEVLEVFDEFALRGG